MNTLATALISVSAALAVTVGAELLRDDRPVAEPAGADAAVMELARSIEGLRSDQAALLREVEELKLRPSGGATRVSPAEIEEVVANYLRNQAAQAEASAPIDVPEPDGMASLDMRTILERLTDDERDWIEREELWQKLREEGRLDEVIAEFERLAELDPNNPDRQVELGYAYIQKIQDVGNSALAGKWADLADKQFDKALALDEAHWSARYMKAVSLSHWPAFTGKSAEAVSQLEQLIEIQGQGPVEDHHEQTYLTLGNIYLGQGKDAEALEAWQKGLALFPSSKSLADQIASLEH